MKAIGILSSAMLRLALLPALPVMFAGCSAALNSAASANDGMYGSHDRVQIANAQREAAEIRKAEAEARRAELEARIAEAQVRFLEEDYGDYDVNPYTSVLADTYESAYARRLRGFNSPTYRMPSSYWNLRYGGSFNYVTAYDPAFYNIMVSGDQVWVEPKYISSMFGTWGATNVTFGLGVYPYRWYCGWGVPYYGSLWGYPRYSWYDWNWGMCYFPDTHFGYGWGPAWGYFGWTGPHYAWGGGLHRPPYVHAPGPQQRPHRQDIVNRPSYTSPSSGKSYGSQPSRGTVNGSGAYRPSSGGTSSPSRTGSGSAGRTTGGGNGSKSTNRSGSSSFFGGSSGNGGSRSGGGSYSSGGYSGGGSGGSRSGSSGGSTGRGNGIGR